MESEKSELLPIACLRQISKKAINIQILQVSALNGQLKDCRDSIEALKRQVTLLTLREDNRRVKPRGE